MAGHMFICILTCSFIQIQVTQAKALLQAKLTENQSLIKPTDSVSLSCRAPSAVSVHQCYFYVNRKNPRPCSCVKTFTGTELLLMSQKTSPAVIEVKCFYTVLNGAVNAPSPHSDPSYITISQKPQISVDADTYFIFICSLPGFVDPHTSCNLYFGEAKLPAQTKPIRGKKNKPHRWFCQFFIHEEDVLSHLQLAQQKDASCDYSDGKSFSPRSDPYNLTDVQTPDKHQSEAKTTSSGKTMGNVTPGHDNTVTVHSTVALISTQTKTRTSYRNPGQTVAAVTTAQLTFGRLRWALLVGVSGAGLTVGIIVFVLACVSAKRSSDKNVQSRNQTNFTAELTCTTSACETGVHSMIECVPATDSTGSDNLHQIELQNDEADVYHMYCIISELPPPSTNMAYSFLQTH
nr:uncharacterized protein LOC129152797 [Nothobranchius furzeri]